MRGKREGKEREKRGERREERGTDIRIWRNCGSGKEMFHEMYIEETDCILYDCMWRTRHTPRAQIFSKYILNAHVFHHLFYLISLLSNAHGY